MRPYNKVGWLKPPRPVLSFWGAVERALTGSRDKHFPAGCRVTAYDFGSKPEDKLIVVTGRAQVAVYRGEAPTA